MIGYKVELGVGLEVFVEESTFLTFVHYIQEKFINNKDFWGYDFGIVKAERSELIAADPKKYNVLDENSFGIIVCYKDTDGNLDRIFIEDHNYQHFMHHIAYRFGIPASRSKWCCPVLDSLANVYCILHKEDPLAEPEILEELCRTLLEFDGNMTAFVYQIMSMVSDDISKEDCDNLIGLMKELLADYESSESDQVKDGETEAIPGND